MTDRRHDYESPESGLKKQVAQHDNSNSHNSSITQFSWQLINEKYIYEAK